jgi:cytoskeletal protein RodZ
MSTVAEQLRQAREARKLSAEQVAEILKIRTDHVRALEEGNYNVFSAPVYIRGFVRTYSTLLKLDVPQLMKVLDGELGQTGKFAEPPPLPHHSRSPLDFIMLQLSLLDWRKTSIVLGVIVVVSAGLLVANIWRKSRASAPLNHLKPGVYQSTQTVSGDTLPLPAPAPRR